MKTLLIATGMAALAMTAAPASAGSRGGWGGGHGGGGWHPTPTPMPHPQPGGWHPNPGGWHPTPTPMPHPQPGGWHPKPMPHPQPGGWHPNPGPIGGNGCLGGCHPNRPRWGGKIGGHWWGGMRAPGGWGGYHRPKRGYTLPTYWIAPQFFIQDYGSYGLPAPPQGYNWSRYYDDAVLVDGSGSVYDSVGGVNWNQYDGTDADYTYYDDGGYADDAGYADGGHGASYGPAYGSSGGGSSGVGGAIVGGVAGGIAGNVIAGRGNRLAGTLIGAGAGAIVGSAIDRSSSRRGYAPAPAPGYGAGYAYPAGGPGVVYQQGAYGGDYAGTTYSGTATYGGNTSVYPGGTHGPGMSRTILADGTVVYTSSRQAGDSHYANGYYYPGTTLTTVTVEGDCGCEEAVEEVDASPPPQDWSYTKQRRRYTK